MPENKRIGDLLVARGLLDRAAADKIGVERSRAQTRYASVAVQRGAVDEDAALSALAALRGVPAVDLSRAIIPKAVVARVPLEIACLHLVLPVRQEGSSLLLAMADPSDWQVIDEVSFATGMSVQPHVALHMRLVELIPKAHSNEGAYFFGPSAPTDVQDESGLLPVVRDAVIAEAKLVDDVEVEVEVEVDDADSEPLVLEPVEQEGGAGRRKLILVVEDEPDIAKLISSSLLPLGHQIITSSRGLEALKLIKSRRPDLIVLDAMLPEVHGFEICRKVKESKRFGRTPVLMLSAIYRGWRIAEDIKATYKVDDFMEKPFRVADLRRRAQTLLERDCTEAEDVALSSNAQMHLDAALECLREGELDTAFADLRQAEMLEPFSGLIQYYLGQALEKRGRVFQALYHYERAVELRPDMFAATKCLAQLYQAQGFRNKAVEMWERSLHAAPSPEVRAQVKAYLVSLL